MGANNTSVHHMRDRTTSRAYCQVFTLFPDRHLLRFGSLRDIHASRAGSPALHGRGAEAISVAGIFRPQGGARQRIGWCRCLLLLFIRATSANLVVFGVASMN